jgi:hypothetical protein
LSALPTSGLATNREQTLGKFPQMRFCERNRYMIIPQAALRRKVCRVLGWVQL